MWKGKRSLDKDGCCKGEIRTLGEKTQNIQLEEKQPRKCFLGKLETAN